MDARALSGALLICLCFGSIHAYGVLLAPVELWLATSRTIASMGYAIAIAALTAGVYLNGRMDTLIGPRRRLIGCGMLGALGLVIAGSASNSTGLLLCFGLMYGLANGIAYATALSIAAAAMPERAARAMGLATAIYGLGAVLWAQLFNLALGSLHVAFLLVALAPAILAACIFGAVLIRPGNAGSQVIETAPPPAKPRALLVLWFSYLLGAFFGLMVLAHAPTIAVWCAGSAPDAGLVSGLVSLGSVVGGYLGGMLAERLPGPHGVALPMIVQSAALGSLPFLSGLAPVATTLGIVGLCYGVLIAVIPAEVRRIGGATGFARLYGRAFTAWGVAGIAGPMTAGLLYDITHAYGAALATAAVLSLFSGIFTLNYSKDC